MVGVGWSQIIVGEMINVSTIMAAYSHKIATADRSIDVDFTFVSRYEENETNDIRKVLKEEVVEKYHWDLDRDLGN